MSRKGAECLLLEPADQPYARTIPAAESMALPPDCPIRNAGRTMMYAPETMEHGWLPMSDSQKRREAQLAVDLDR